MTIKKTTFITSAIVLLVIFSALIYIFFFVLKDKPLDVGKVDYGIGGEYELTNHLGKKVTNKDFLGKYQLIYFGYTYCPDICPTSLQNLTLVMQLLGSLADQITPMFITFDPERDTVEQMKNYVGFFDKRLIGLVGTKEQTEKITKEYRVYYKRVESEELSDYTIDHSAFFYFMDKKGKFIKLFNGHSKPPEEVAAQIRKIIEAGA